ncbi:MAG: hypothetical protein QOE79_2975 [Sphingomonadales bacterium]|nr:hypothetical protein [Sphingomonadales bacterium]
MDVRTIPESQVEVALWLAEGLLALFFLFAGLTLLVNPLHTLAHIQTWTVEDPTLVSVAALADLAGALGILLPRFTRAPPNLYLAAVLCLSALQVMAMMFHLERGEMALLLMATVLFALSLFLLWGRREALAGTLG